ncbi:MAG: PIN domain-containing protein [Burkholderiales bacterium]
MRATGKSVPTLVSEYLALAQTVEPRRLPAPVSRDPDDDAVIACAVAARAHLIVSGDKDLRSLGAFRSIRVASPAEVLQLIA